MAGFVRGQSREVRPAGVELVAVRAGQPLDAGFIGEGHVQHAAGPAVRVRHEDAVVAGAASPDPVAHGLGDAARPVVERGRQAGDVDVGQAAGQVHQLARERATADDQDARGIRVGARSWS